MTDDKRKNKIGIKWHIFLYMLFFTAVIILLLWLGQVVFLDRIYKQVKTNEIKDAASKISDDIGKSNVGETIDEIAQNEICISVYQMKSNTNGIELYYNHANRYCVIHDITADSILSFYNNTKNAGGKYMERFFFDSSRRDFFGIEGDFFKNEQKSPEKDLPENIIYSVISTDDNGNEIFILLNSVISPLTATVNTLNTILIAVSMLLIVLSLILSFVISHRITKPINKLTKSATDFAKGNYNADFSSNSYKEVNELSDALNYAQSELSKTDTLRKELIANISHDLRTPLTMISGYSEMMRDIPGENSPENAQIIVDEANRLSTLVNDLLDISKLESGVGEYNPQPTEFTKAVQKTLNRFAKLCASDGYDIEFIYDRELSINYDENRIMQVVYNLVSNAITHTGEDKSVKIRQIVANGYVRIEVTDTGEGIPKDKLPYIWDRYYKVDKVHQRSHIGTGLGLSIVKGIIESAKGRYGVISTMNTGSTFWFELPL